VIAPTSLIRLVFPIALLAATATLLAQGSDDPCSSNPNPPGDVALRLSLKNGRTVFHEGEMITLNLQYSADVPKEYIASTANYDRSGRLEGADVFCIDPDPDVDPLHDYFSSLMAIMGGGLSSEVDVGEKPFEIDLDLNEWKTLPPGSYHVTVVGNRIKRGTEADMRKWNKPNIPLRSNSVEFEVVAADPDWQAAQLGAATRTLDSPDASDEEKKHAARVLRFLGSEGATRELARRYLSSGDGFSWEMKFGLFGSPHRALAIDAMRAELTDAQHPVTQEYVDTLVRLEMQSDEHYRMPRYDPSHQEEFNKAREAYEAEFKKRVNNYFSEAAEFAAAKQQPEARAMSASEILLSDLPLTPEAKVRWRQALLFSWDSLPVQKQNELIEYRWDQVGDPEWLPVLESIVAGESSSAHFLNKPDRGAALRRINQISSDTGHKMILGEIQNPHGDIGIETLGLLPDRELPQIDAPMIALIRSNGVDIDYQLVDRYASAQALPKMKEIYEQNKGKWACVPEYAMLRYFVRVDLAYGVKQISDVLGSHAPGGCVLSPLTALKEYIRIPQLEAVAIATLDDPSPQTASDAAQALQKYGSPKAENALWARMEKFHRKLERPARRPPAPKPRNHCDGARQRTGAGAGECHLRRPSLVRRCCNDRKIESTLKPGNAERTGSSVGLLSQRYLWPDHELVAGR
jgi:hypothetical protein